MTPFWPSGERETNPFPQKSGMSVTCYLLIFPEACQTIIAPTHQTHFLQHCTPLKNIHNMLVPLWSESHCIEVFGNAGAKTLGPEELPGLLGVDP